MRKIVFIAILALCVTTYSSAETAQNDTDAQDMAQLRKKLIQTKREMDSFMKELLNTYSDQNVSGLSGFGQEIRVDVTDNLNEFIVRADLPGMDKDKINITLDNGKILKISGVRDVLKKETGPGVVRQERMQGNFSRVLELPEACKSEGIKASYANGVLEVTIPKKEKTKEEQVKIKIQ